MTQTEKRERSTNRFYVCKSAFVSFKLPFIRLKLFFRKFSFMGNMNAKNAMNAFLWNHVVVYLWMVFQIRMNVKKVLGKSIFSFPIKRVNVNLITVHAT